MPDLIDYLNIQYIESRGVEDIYSIWLRASSRNVIDLQIEFRAAVMPGFYESIGGSAAIFLNMVLQGETSI